MKLRRKKTRDSENLYLRDINAVRQLCKRSRKAIYREEKTHDVSNDQ